MSLREFGHYLEKRLQDLLGPRRAGPLSSGVLAQVREIVARDIRERFANSNTPRGKPWKPLKWRRGKPLVLTGRLRRSAVGMGQQAKVSRSFRTQGKYGITISLDTGQLVSYGLFQNDGTRRIPARQFVGVSERALQEIAGLLLKDLEASVRKELGG